MEVARAYNWNVTVSSKVSKNKSLPSVLRFVMFAPE